VYIGQAAYRSLEGKNGWEDWSQLPRQVIALRQKENIDGSVYFSSRSLMNNMAGFSDSLRLDLYRYPALPPPMKWLDSISPEPPQKVKSTVIDRFVRLRWEVPEMSKDGEEVYGYIVYRFEENEPIDFDNGTHVKGIRFKPETFYFDTKCDQGKKYRYAIRAMDRVKNLSEPTSIINVEIPDKWIDL